MVSVVSRCLSFTPLQQTMKSQEMDWKWYRISLYHILQGRHESTVQYKISEIKNNCCAVG